MKSLAFAAKLLEEGPTTKILGLQTLDFSYSRPNEPPARSSPTISSVRRSRAAETRKKLFIPSLSYSAASGKWPSMKFIRAFPPPAPS